MPPPERRGVFGGNTRRGGRRRPLVFYLGTGEAAWLETAPPHVPLCVSRNRLAHRRSLPRRAAGRWILDSSGFTMLQQFGRFTISAEDYVQEVLRFSRQIGRLDWASPQDWMCEPWVLRGGWHKGQYFVGTGLTVPEHQELTVASFQRTTWLWQQHSDDSSPFRPVIQGFSIADYRRCWSMYGDAGVDLRSAPLIGLGSVCRREATGEIADILDMLHDLAPLAAFHGYGVKTAGLARYGADLASADSMAWSYGARRRPDGTCPDGRKSCSTCMHRALAWYQRVLDAYDTGPEKRPSAVVPPRRSVRL
jgi:hypothetical protein